MRELIYAMRFTGRATPAGPDGNVLQAVMTAPSSAITVTVGAGGLACTLVQATGAEARLASELTFTGAQSFQEIGMIVFGGGNTLRFSTILGGYLGPGASPARRHGAVAWRIDGGDGQFAGASGLITSNVVFGEGFTLTGHQFGVIYLP